MASQAFLNDQGTKKENGSLLLNSSVPEDENVIINAVSELSTGSNLVPHQQNPTLPEDILENILMQFPVSARCQLRCVCQKWKRDLLCLPYPATSIQSYTMFTMLENRVVGVFDHYTQQSFAFSLKRFAIPPWSDFRPPAGKGWEKVMPYYDFRSHLNTHKWAFTNPSNVGQLRGARWKLKGVDAGLLFYQTKVRGSFWLCVTNPLPSAFRVIPPNYCHTEQRVEIEMLKLQVDSRRHRFQVFLVLQHDPKMTAIFNSTTSFWLLCRHPNFFRFDMIGDYREDYYSQGISMNEMFMWKDVIYAYSRTRDLRLDLLVELKLESGRWTANRYSEVPSENGRRPDEKHWFVSNKNQLLLIQVHCTSSSSFSVWKLLDDESGNATSDESSNEKGHSQATFLKWKKVIDGSSGSMERDAGGKLSLEHCHLHDSCLGSDYMCFVLARKEVTAGSRIPKCLKYSFADQSWSVVPSPRSWRPPFKVFHWEPNPHMNPSSPGPEDSTLGARAK